MKESETYEHKSQFDGSPRVFLEITKTIVAFANTRGGVVQIQKVLCDPDMLDSARLDDFVNKYVEPRVMGIESGWAEDGTWTIKVSPSASRPHIFVHEANYVDAKKRSRSAFHPGQIFVRHSSKTEPASADDLRLIIQEVVGSWIGKLGQTISNFSLQLSEGGAALPVRLSDVPGALQISVADVNSLFPYTAKTLGPKLGKGQNWVAKACKKLGLRDDPSCCQLIYGAGKQPVAVKYNEHALQILMAELQKNPDFDPFH